MQEALTLAQLAANGKAGVMGDANVIELLNQATPLLRDFPIIPANDGSGHKAQQATSLGSVAWARLHQGIPETRATDSYIRFTTGALEAMCSADTRTAQWSGMEGLAKEKERSMRGALTQMMIDGEAALFYEDENNNPERITGLTPHYNNIMLGGERTNVSKNIIDAGGTGSTNCSIWVISWSPNTISAIHPQHASSMLTVESFDGQSAQDSQGRTYFKDHTVFRLFLGLQISDWRNAVRICNIDVNQLRYDGSSGAKLVTLLDEALTRLPWTYGGIGGAEAGMTRIFIPRAIGGILTTQRKRALDNSTLTRDENEMPWFSEFNGHLISVSDALRTNEPRVV